jgi:hypothetical protein
MVRNGIWLETVAVSLIPQSTPIPSKSGSVEVKVNSSIQQDTKYLLALNYISYP